MLFIPRSQRSRLNTLTPFTNLPQSVPIVGWSSRRTFAPHWSECIHDMSGDPFKIVWASPTAKQRGTNLLLRSCFKRVMKRTKMLSINTTNLHGKATWGTHSASHDMQKTQTHGMLSPCDPYLEKKNTFFSSYQDHSRPHLYELVAQIRFSVGWNLHLGGFSSQNWMKVTSKIAVTDNPQNVHW